MQHHFYAVPVLLAFAATALIAQEPPRSLPLDELLETPISTAAKYDQQLSSVAASVTVITAEEIERYGWTSLDDAIQSVRGMYLTNDRNYSTFGVRGIGRPRDYNARILVLIDGHSMNGSIWGEAATGGVLAIDLDTVEKIEIVRGPASALYGSHAMLAVINVITKRADELDALSLSVSSGSEGARKLSFQSGRELANGMRLTASAHWSDTEGEDLYYPMFQDPGISDGIARGLDYERAFNVAFGLEKGGLRVSLSTRSQNKGVPNASYGTTFNTDSNTVDTRDLAVVTYNRGAGLGKTLELRGFWDRVRTRGEWVYGDTLGIDHTFDMRIGGEANLHWDVRPNQRLTIGTQLTNHPVAEYKYVVGDYAIDITRPFTESSYYLQHEYHPTPRWGFVSGVRHDRFTHAPASTNPRAAILYTPSRATTFKLLYGTAFLAPTLYQVAFADPATPWKVNPSLTPESVRTLELVCERRLSPDVLLVGTAYRIKASSLIEVQVDPADSVNWYQNLGAMTSQGAELGLDWRTKQGIWAHMSYARQRAKGHGEHLVNSPSHLLKAGISTSPWKKLHAGMEAVYESARHTRGGDETPAFLLLHGTVSRHLGERVRASLSIRNLLDSDYSLPTGVELRPEAEQQDGRTLTFALSYSR